MVTDEFALRDRTNKYLGARLNSICAGFRRNPTEPMLFSWGCLLAEVLHECRLTPRKYRGLLESAAMGTPLWTTLGPEGVRRTIDRAFTHVEAKGNPEEVPQTGGLKRTEA
jgi:hypothetical protein